MAAELVVDIHGLTRRFGSLVAVDGLQLQVPKGAVYGLLGPNGAGKTTTFSMLLGYTRPHGGSGTILGSPLSNVASRRGRLGALPQDAGLPEHARVGSLLSHYGHLGGLERRKSKEEARRVLDLFRLGDRYDAKIRELSHGMRKRVAMAQAFMGEPELVFLDEPTSGLDPRLRHEVRSFIRHNPTRCTIVVSSHDLAEIEEISDHVAILSRGKLVRQGSTDEIRGSGKEIIFEVGARVPAAVLAALEGKGWKASYEEKRSRVVVEVNSAEDLDRAMGEGMNLLVEAGIPVRGVTKGRSLEERFLDLT